MKIISVEIKIILKNKINNNKMSNKIKRKNFLHFLNYLSTNNNNSIKKNNNNKCINLYKINKNKNLPYHNFLIILKIHKIKIKIINYTNKKTIKIP